MEPGILYGLCALTMMVIANVLRIKCMVRKEWSLPLIVLLVSVAVFASIPLLLLFPVLWAYRELVKTYLKLKHGSKFVGLITGADVIYTCGEHEKSIITILFMLKCSNTQKPEDVYDHFKGSIFKAAFSNIRELQAFRSGVKRCGGYSYMCKEDVTVDDCVRKMEVMKCERDKLSENELKTLLHNCISEKFPKNNTLFMDTFVGTQPVVWNGCSDKNVHYYPALVRLHHAMCDGFAVTQIFAVMGDKSKEADERSKTAYFEKLNQGSIREMVLNYFVMSLCTMIFTPSELLLKVIFKKPKPNILRGPELSGVDVLSMKTDDGQYYKRIKKIKSVLSGVGFADIVLTALSASLKDYFQNHSSYHPKSISVVVPFLSKASIIPQLPIGQLTPCDISLKNSFAMLTFDLPLFLGDNNNQLCLMQRLHEVKKQSKRAYNSIGNKILYFLSHFLIQFLPLPILTKLHDKLHWSAIISVLPGPPQTSIADNNAEIENIVFWAPLLSGMGINVSILSYANKMQLGLKVDKALIQNEEDAQGILDGVFKYIDLFEEEISLGKSKLVQVF
ncbi:hypothetical protein RI129_008628 [Pyrocoelia pectoralis]|uniref:O-acyltransferase WSD1 C-terminal domain-containing protein n=1 Tax=Pyrocoelia pectoralis TaxID=417401 RepID=A0AAN7VBG3_9COLE